MPRVLVFGASASPNSVNAQLAKYASTYLTCEVQQVNFADYYCPEVFVQGNPVPEKVLQFKELLTNSQGVLLSIAEHNFGPNSAWKNTLDWLSRSGQNPNVDWNITFQNKPVLVLGTSPAPSGAKLTVENATTYYPYLGAQVVGSFTLPSFYTNFQNGVVVDESLRAALEAEVNKLNAALQQ